MEEREQLMADWYDKTGWEFIGKDRVATMLPSEFIKLWSYNVRWVENNLGEADSLINDYRNFHIA